MNFRVHVACQVRKETAASQDLREHQVHLDLVVWMDQRDTWLVIANFDDRNIIIVDIIDKYILGSSYQ